MLIIETWVIMVGDGPDCCHSGRPVHTGRRVCSVRRVLVHMYFIHVYTSIYMYVVPFPYLKPFVLVPRLQNNLRGILQNPDRILKKVWPNMQNLLGKFRISFQNKSLIFLGEIKLPNSNSTGKSGTQICDAAPGGCWGAFLRLHLVHSSTAVPWY